MNKKIGILASLCCSISLSMYAESNMTSQNIEPKSGFADKNIVGGIALFVNGEPITLHAIKQVENALHTDRLRATDILVNEKLKEAEIKRLKIEINDMQLDAQIAQIAQQNNMNLDQFYAAIVQEGMSLVEYRTKLKDQMLAQELMRKILFSSNVGQEDELRKYYNEHLEEFVIPKEVVGTKFVSHNKQTLESFIQQGISATLPDSIAHSEETLEISTLPAQVADIFLATEAKSFTQIFESGNGDFVAFYIKEKISNEQVEFEKAKNYIAQKLIANNQEKILNDYFERVRSRSKIVFVR
ncbi:peptidylprolyl isomerase [Helicobacter trogontum]|uniref:Peptidyl-prolyl cis-trans isomerase n=1 Tax=Helicobacter trogontum TaxID=50960 RepID=A0A4U8TDG7_9HELI|nr:peptidylprolyl isomerase [Helicobacter trogontum]MCI5786868.1 peptidyl-prolyl cis-trans isomerase [Helicobacter trogontum]MDY5185400.1 peptidylprolyl isomerase [Helicobacter trogontum]TLD98056.1 peptidyl-prolyl cis-trans isomerase [Helicobacter trogontum]